MKVSTIAEALTAIQEHVAEFSTKRVTIYGNRFTVETNSGEGNTCVVFDSPTKLVRSLGLGTDDQEIYDLAQQIYLCYPRRRDPAASMKAIAKAIRDESIPVPNGDRPMYLAIAATLFAMFCEKEGKEKTFIPYPATWFNRQSYLNGVTQVLRLLKSQSLNTSIPLKERAKMVCQSAKPQNAWTQLKEPLGSSAPNTNE